MSNFLDQLLMEDIARYCPTTFVAYHKCISANRTNPAACNKEQFELSQCIKSDVPSLKLILTECDSKLKNYSDCMMKGEGKGCEDSLKEIRDCAEQFVGKDNKGAMNQI
ncbi:hypothetical protein WICPIJ_006122 [Wickerhamomyces pijperi]|uniref:IMS import disulfide relay-system CHCH-CHCH-like Cx9C domain-containing protein n=1 Tax=Wickerhamomyces pijperi TaxID=599730 RepID=A0A9P8Q2E0_WICPI|nr:hypothetical protein WICPIJ_006122 [Wickerhamomyces pijperi]